MCFTQKIISMEVVLLVQGPEIEQEFLLSCFGWNWFGYGVGMIDFTYPWTLVIARYKKWLKECELTKASTTLEFMSKGVGWGWRKWLCIQWLMWSKTWSKLGLRKLRFQLNCICNSMNPRGCARFRVAHVILLILSSVYCDCKEDSKFCYLAPFDEVLLRHHM